MNIQLSQSRASQFCPHRCGRRLGNDCRMMDGIWVCRICYYTEVQKIQRILGDPRDSFPSQSRKV